MANQGSLVSLSPYKTAPKFSFPHQGTGQERVRQSPAPGSYKVVTTDTDKFARSASYTMLGQSGSCFGGRNSQPGPGAYNPSKDHSYLKAPTWAIGTEARLADKKEMKKPGPGEYNTIQATAADALQITMSGRFDFSKKAMTPAPTAYKPGFENLSTFPVPQRTSFGSSSRTSFRDNAVPGPGKYEALAAAKNGYKTAPQYTMRQKYKDAGKKKTGPDFMSSMTSFK